MLPYRGWPWWLILPAGLVSWNTEVCHESSWLTYMICLLPLCDPTKPSYFPEYLDLAFRWSSEVQYYDRDACVVVRRTSGSNLSCGNIICKSSISSCPSRPLFCDCDSSRDSRESLSRHHSFETLASISAFPISSYILCDWSVFPSATDLRCSVGLSGFEQILWRSRQ